MTISESLRARFDSVSAPVQGALLMTFAAACFALMNLVIREVASTLHPLETAFFRNLFALIVGTSGAFLIWEKQEAASKTSPLLPDDLRRLRNQQMGEINAYRWVSEKDGVVRIPVERAMEIVAAEEAGKAGKAGKSGR